jgi:hypothetical protein
MINDRLRDGAAVISLPLPVDPDVGCNEMQAAIFLGLSVRTLQAWRVRGGGPRYVKIGRAVRYQRRELVAFQRLHTVDSTTEANAVRQA